MVRERRRLSISGLLVVSVLVLVPVLASCAPDVAVPTETVETVPPEEALPDPPVEETEEPVELTRYLNERYGFSLRYPSDWAAWEGRNFVSLSQESVTLVVGFRHETEDPNICCRERLPEGELVDAGTVTCAGEEIERVLLQCDGRTKAVLYEGTEEIALGDLRFLFYLEDFGADYDAGDISGEVLVQMDRVIESLETFEPSEEFVAATPAATQRPATPTPTVATTEAEGETPTPVRAVAEAVEGGALVRSGPGPGYPIRGLLPGGEQAEITGQYVNWWRILYEGDPGWVYDDVVETRRVEDVPVVEPGEVPEPDPETPTPEAATPEAEATPPQATAEAFPRGANVRAGPGLSYPLEGFLEGGETVEITGRHDGWWQVDYEGTPAWIYSGVVRATGTDYVPVVDAVPTPVPRSPAVIPTAAPPEEIDEERWIDVSLSEQRLRAYENGEVVRTSLVSTGLPQTPTPPGQFRIWIKLRYDDMSGPGYYYPNVPYVMYYYRGYGIHGTYWHDNFGQPMSAGCVNLPVEEAAWVYDFVDVGTLINVRP